MFPSGAAVKIHKITYHLSPLLKKNIQTLWVCQYFFISKFYCWIQDVSFFSVKSILIEWTQGASSFHTTLWKCSIGLWIGWDFQHTQIFSKYRETFRVIRRMWKQPSSPAQYSSNSRLKEHEAKNIFNWRGDLNQTI